MINGASLFAKDSFELKKQCPVVEAAFIWDGGAAEQWGEPANSW